MCWLVHTSVKQTVVELETAAVLSLSFAMKCCHIRCCHVRGKCAATFSAAKFVGVCWMRKLMHGGHHDKLPDFVWALAGVLINRNSLSEIEKLLSLAPS